MKVLFLRQLFLPLVIIALLGIFSFSSCKKEETKCKAVITAKFLSDTNLFIQGASIIVEKRDIFMTGVTDKNGQFEFTRELEAILDIDARVDTSSYDTISYVYEGSTVIRLKPGETIYRTVFLSPI